MASSDSAMMSTVDGQSGENRLFNCADPVPFAVSKSFTKNLEGFISTVRHKPTFFFFFQDTRQRERREKRAKHRFASYTASRVEEIQHARWTDGQLSRSEIPSARNPMHKAIWIGWLAFVMAWRTFSTPYPSVHMAITQRSKNKDKKQSIDVGEILTD